MTPNNNIMILFSFLFLLLKQSRYKNKRLGIIIPLYTPINYSATFQFSLPTGYTFKLMYKWVT